MMSEWRVTNLGDCANWYSGGTPKTSTPEYWGGDIPWITASSLHDFYITDSERKVTPLGIQNGTRLMPKNTILFVVQGMSLKTQFRVGIACRPVAFGQDCKALVTKEGVDPLFLANFLRSKADEILAISDEASHGTGRLETSAIQMLQVMLPPLSEQKAIASILGTLDDKIELNRRMNETLEAMARAIFKDWFVDFGPTRAKRSGRNPYLPEPIWSLFPDAIDPQSGLPMGWETRELSSLTSELRRGISPKYTDASGIRVLNQKCIRNRMVSYSFAKWHDSNAKPVRGRELISGDILVNSTGVGTLGRVAQIWTLDGTTIVDSHVTVVRANKNFTTTLYLGFNLTGREEEIESLGEGTTGQTELSRNRLGLLSVLIPSYSAMLAFDSTVEPLVSKIESHQKESRTLAELRDRLLPKLMSGEIRVKDAEKKVEEVM